MLEEQQRPSPVDNSFPQALVARQPICERNQKTFGYELLFRHHSSSDSGEAVIHNADQATAQVIVNSFFEIGLDRMVGASNAFINVTKEFILGNHCRSLPKERVIIEILEDTIPDADLLRSLDVLTKEGYRFALDDFAYQEQLLPLLPYCSIVKVDLRQAGRDRMESEIASLREYPVMLLAEKVETMEEFEFCQKAGFEYFQGYYFCRPNLVSTAKLPLNRLNVCRLVAKLQQPDIQTSEVEKMIGEDVALSYRLLRYINSAALSLPRKIESINHAVRLVGINKIRMLTNLAMLSSMDDKPRELMVTSLVRARMCQLLANSNACRSEESAFTVGLFSALDAFLDCTMEKALQLLPLADDICNALLSRKGALGRVLEMVLAYEQGDWATLDRMNADTRSLRDAYLQSLDWGEGLMRQAVDTPSTRVM